MGLNVIIDQNEIDELLGFSAAPAGVDTPAATTPPPTMEQKPVVNATPASFSKLSESKADGSKSEIDLIRDIPLELSVELGRTRRSISDILDFGIGTVVELNRLAGEPVDLMANGKLIARGEVVVIDENFAIRVTEIVSQKKPA